LRVPREEGGLIGRRTPQTLGGPGGAFAPRRRRRNSVPAIVIATMSQTIHGRRSAAGRLGTIAAAISPLTSAPTKTPPRKCLMVEPQYGNAEQPRYWNQ